MMTGKPEVIDAYVNILKYDEWLRPITIPLPLDISVSILDHLRKE